MDTLVNGLGLLESPRWSGDRLWFADWTAGQILTIDESGRREVVAQHASLPLCFDFLPDGSPVLVSGPSRALLRWGPDGGLTTYADLSGLSRYGCNDIVVDGRGNAYVNNGNAEFGATTSSGEVAPGFVALVTTDGAARVVADDLAFPNGMAVTADNRTLVVADSYRHQLVGFDITPDGSLSSRRVWADLGDDAPDGICLDAEGAAWYASVPGRHCVRVAEGGEVLNTVRVDRGAFACMLGGRDRSTLFIVGATWPGAQHLMDHTDWDGTVWSVPAPVPGGGWPGPSECAAGGSSSAD
jgi:sugar lactone lactonase YvrE